MSNYQLYAISPLDGRYSQKLVKLSPITSEFGLIKYRVLVEVKWLIHLINHSNIIALEKYQADTQLNSIIDNFSEENALAIKKIEATTNHDVKAVEYFLRNVIQSIPELKPLLAFIHFGCTSEDINNLAYALMLQDARNILSENWEKTIQKLTDLSHSQSEVAMLSRTHGQPASPTTLGKEFSNIVARLTSQLQSLSQISITGKFNGAVGNFNAHLAAFPNHDWQQISKNFVESLGLEYNAYTTQIEPHDNLASLLHNVQRINTILIDLSCDTWQYIGRDYFSQKKLEHEVGSSTMPHKVNPIDFENAEGNLGIANALANHLATTLPISRLQRDLSDSTVLRNLGVIFGHSLLANTSLLKGLNKLVVNEDIIAKDLDQHWEVLAEPIQTVLRANGVVDAYEQLKALTRGATINAEHIHAFIATLDLPDEDKHRLSEMTPQSYIGLAAILAKSV